MKVLHTYCLNYNIGDYYLGIGVKNLLRQYLNIDSIAETNIQGTVFNEYFINEVVNKKYDLLVVGGGGIIHGAHWPNGWFWLIEEKLIAQIKIPFIVYGVGYNYFKDEGGIPEIGRSHLRKTIEKAAYFSIRNDESVDRFEEQMEVIVPEVPDPGFHINLNKKYTCKEKVPFVLVQLANDKPEHRFGGKDKQSIFINEMKIVVKSIARNYKVIICPHVYDDIKISQEIIKEISNTEVWDFSKYAFDNCPESLGYYQDAEFVLAMRGHGQIIPIAFGTPVIALVNHPKHSGLMKKLGLNEFSIQVNSDNFSFSLLKLIGSLVLNKSNYLEKLVEINKVLSAQSKKAFDDIKKAIS